MSLTYGTAAPNPTKSSQKIRPEVDLAGFAKKGRMLDLLELEPKSGTSLVTGPTIDIKLQLQLSTNK